MKTINIVVEKENDTNLSKASNLFNGFSGLLNQSGIFSKFTNNKYLSLEIIKINDLVNFYISCDDNLVKELTESVYSVYPKTSIINCLDPIKLFSNSNISKLKFSKPYFFPVKVSEDIYEHFLHHIINSLSNLETLISSFGCKG